MEALLIVVAVGRQKILAVVRGVVEHRLRDDRGRSSRRSTFAGLADLLRPCSPRQCERHRAREQHRLASSRHLFPPSRSGRAFGRHVDHAILVKTDT